MFSWSLCQLSCLSAWDSPFCLCLDFLHHRRQWLKGSGASLCLQNFTCQIQTLGLLIICLGCIWSQRTAEVITVNSSADTPLSRKPGSCEPCWKERYFWLSFIFKIKIVIYCLSYHSPCFSPCKHMWEIRTEWHWQQVVLPAPWWVLVRVWYLWPSFQAMFLILFVRK